MPDIRYQMIRKEGNKIDMTRNTHNTQITNKCKTLLSKKDTKVYSNSCDDRFPRLGLVNFTITILTRKITVQYRQCFGSGPFYTDRHFCRSPDRDKIRIHKKMLNIQI